MAISVDPATKVISVPQADLTLVSGTLYDMQTETYFRAAANAWAASEDGIVFQPPIDHNTSYTVVGVTYARKIELINSYSLTFTPNSQWTVRLQGSNNNLFDVANGILNQNQVQVIPGNSAGQVEISTGSGLSAAQDTKLTEIHGEVDSIEGGFGLAQWIRLISAAVTNRMTGADTGTVHARDMANTKDRLVVPVSSDGRGQPTTRDPD